MRKCISPASYAGEVGGKAIFLQVSAGPERWHRVVGSREKVRGPEPPLVLYHRPRVSPRNGGVLQHLADHDGRRAKTEKRTTSVWNATLLITLQGQHRGKEGWWNIGPWAMDGGGRLTVC